MNITLALFDSTRAVLKADRACKVQGIFCKIIPVPHDLSSDCGMALKFDSKDRLKIEQMLRDEVLNVRFFERGQPGGEKM